MLYGRKCPPTETVAALTSRPALIARILGLISLFGVFAGAQTHSPPLDDQTLRPELPSKLCWTLNRENIDGEKIASDNARIYFTIFDAGTVVSVDTAAGTVEWTADLGGRIKTAPHISGDGLFVITQNDENYTVRRLNRTTGLTVWQTQIIRPAERPPEIYLSSLNDTLITAATDGSIYAFDSDSGKISGKAFIQGGITTEPYFEGNRIIFGSANRRINILPLNDLTTSAELNEGLTVPSEASVVLKINDRLIWGDASGVVHLSERRRKTTSLKSKEKWRLRTGGSIANLTLTGSENGNDLLISSLDNFIYLAALKTGKLVWKKRLPGRPVFAPQTAGRYLILTDVDGSAASIVEIGSGRTVNRLNLPEKGFFTGAARITPQFIILAGTGGLYAFTFRSACGD